MRIESKHNRIVIVFSFAESKFLTHKAAAAGQKNVITYVKAKLIEALGLKIFEDGNTIKLANDFNLSKIKKISVELSQRKTASEAQEEKEESFADDETGLISEDDLVEEALEEELHKPRATKGIDDLLGDLLDQDLLKGQKRAPKKPENTPKPD